MRDSGFPGRPQDRAAELPLFRRHGGTAAQCEAGGLDRELGAARLAAADHRYAEEGGGGGLLRSHPLLQRRPEAACASEGRDGPLHARGGAKLSRQAPAKRAMKLRRLASLAAALLLFPASAPAQTIAPQS